MLRQNIMAVATCGRGYSSHDRQEAEGGREEERERKREKEKERLQ
jgi:hypothetical protein